MTDQERAAMQMALEALEDYPYDDATWRNVYAPTSSILRAALEQPEQEPVAWPEGYEPHELPADYTGKLWIEGQVRRLYEAPPPRREWRGLSEQERHRLWRKLCEGEGLDEYAEAIEAALKERNV